MPQNDTGYLLVSFDTELAWGYHDLDAARQRIFTADGSRERQSIRRVLDLCDEYGIAATWAVVGHLFYSTCEDCELCPILDWRGRYSSFDVIYQTDHPLWYAPEIMDWIQSTPHQEIAFHGYTHRVFSESVMSDEQAQLEIDEWRRAAERRGLMPHSVVFPRNRVGHLDCFKAHNFVSYRSDVYEPLPLRAPYVGKVLRTLDQVLGITTPPVHDPVVDASGLVNHKASAHLFAFNRKVELTLDRLNLPLLRMRRMRRAVRHAAEQRKVVHLWAHPWEFRTDADIDKLRYVFDYAHTEIQRGRLQSISMTDLARQFLDREEVKQ